MKILFAVWELDPFFKVGGLGDVARSFPAALKEKGVDIRIVLPYYKVLKLGRQKRVKLGKIRCFYDNKNEDAEIYKVEHPISKIPVYLIKNKKYLDIAKFPDTFAFFSLAIAEIIKSNILSWTPDIIHCNDVHTGLVPLLLKEKKVQVKTLLTIHNLSYQGKTSIDVLDKLKIETSKCAVLHWEIKSRKVSFLLEGIIHADAITTVSPTYAREVLTEEYGCGLEDVLRGKEGRIFGILNGIDNNWHHMMANRGVKYPYLLTKENIAQNNALNVYSWEEGKKLNKLYLQKKLGLKVDQSIPLVSFIGRFDPYQKGVDIIHKMLRRLNLEKYEFVILGSGDPHWEERFQWLAKFYPKNISCNFIFDEVLAHQIYAGSDFILIPSKFEPCGLVQMVAMFFGTVPIAHATGGLRDSIKDSETGYLFNKYSSASLENSLNKAIGIWLQDRKRYRTMVENAMKMDFSWDKSAREYLNLYQKLIDGKL